jgi:ubiquinone/menaquinone biosynthesis C-methylase UbiE
MDWNQQGGNAAQEYADFMVPAMFEPFAGPFVQAAGVREGAAVLDVACGTGAVSRAAARAAGPEGRVTGVDLGVAMLAVARATPAEAGAAPITYLEAPAEALPVEAASFDAATCHHGLQFFSDREAALRGVHGALRPGARAAVAVWAAIEHQAHFLATAQALERHVGEEAATIIRSPFALDDDDLLAGLLTGAGFTDVTVTRDTRPVVYASYEDFARRLIGAGPLAGRFAQAPEDVRRQVGDGVAQALRDLRTNSGRLASEMTSVIAVGTA